jgi:hypothetical protein
MVSGFNKMQYAPGERQVEKWAARYPAADLVFVAGLCETGRGKQGVIVVDCDDETAVSRASKLFGETPGRVRTRRGEHRYFRDDGANLGTLSSLRAYGLNIDLKHGQHGAAIVAAPPSPHEKDRDFRYTWASCGPDVLKALPPFRASGLFDFLEKSRPAANLAQLTANRAKAPFNARADSRGLWLNDQLVKHGPFFDGEAAELLNSVLDKARQLNESLAELGFEPLGDSEVLRRSKQIVQDIENGKIERRLARRATCTSDADEIRFLCSLANGADAFALLQLFRSEHAGKISRGETFAICIGAMARSRVMGSWSERKYREARDVLLQEGFIREIWPARWKRAAEYTLERRILTPSLAIAPLAGTTPGGGRQGRYIGEQNARAVSVSQRQPWEAEGVSKSTYYRRRRKAKAATLANPQQQHDRVAPRAPLKKSAYTSERTAA